MNLGAVRTAIALTSTLENLPDDAEVWIETPEGDAQLVHMRSTEEGHIIFSTREPADVAHLQEEVI